MEVYMTLRTDIIKLATAHPELRTHLVPLLRQAREKQAGPTEDYKRIERLGVAVAEPLAKANHLLFGWQPITPDKLDGVAPVLAAAAKDLADALVFDIENESTSRIYDSLKPKVRNFTKLLEAYQKVQTGADLVEVLKKQNTKSKDPYQKFLEYRDLVLSFIKHFDSEPEGTIRVGPYTVSLVSAHHDNWDADKLEILREVLKRAAAAVNRAGLPSIVGGTVFAFPVRVLPLAVSKNSALAWYNHANNTMALAVGDDIAATVKTLVHETGHRAYFKLIENRSHTAWEMFFENNSGAPPNLNQIIADWEAWASSDDHWAKKYGRNLGEYLSYGPPKSDPVTRMWLMVLADKLGLKEDRHSITGDVKKGQPPALDQLIAKQHEAKVFLYPVTAYSATSPEELYAETFAVICLKGPGAVPEILRDAFYNVLPQFRRGSQI